jgi:hypothetical protein
MWPKLSNIDENIKNKIFSYKTPDKASELSPWIRVFSGAVKNGLQGLILQSNTSAKLLRATGETTATIYGDSQSSGIVGKTWDDKPVESNSTRFLRPSPIVTGFSVKEGQDQISREATLQLTAYTLEQMEEIQSYFLEPGYSLFIEWGWNTISGARGVVETVGNSVDKILKTISSKTLNWEDLVSTRLNALGEYDGFLGFIVGGSVSSEGDTFSIEVRLRGEPSLPTYLQSYRNSKKLTNDKTSVSSSDKVLSLFSVEELTDENDSSVAKRRFQYMFNELPSDKQLNRVKNLINSSVITPNMFINFDKHIEKNVIGTASGKYAGNTALNDAQIEIQREDLFSKNKYVRMDLVVQILNTLGKLDSFTVGDKQVSFQIDINNTVIGGFPYMFSTNKNKLIIPGIIPNFTPYFLASGPVIQGETDANGSLVDPSKINGLPPNNPDDTLESFLGSSSLSGEYKEDANYYGYLKYLFINFDILKSAINKKIINSREAFIYILNEISSAVNAFWKFQVVEGEFKPSYSPFIGPVRESQSRQNFISTDSANQQLTTSGDSSGLKVGDIILTVIDENFVGKLPDDIDKNVTVFPHNGVGSVFLSSNLDISLPSSMVGQIVSTRLGAAVNPDAPVFSVGGFFNSETDLFVRITQDINPPPENNNDSPQDTTSSKLKEEFDNNYQVYQVGGGINVYRVPDNGRPTQEDFVGTAQLQGNGTLKVIDKNSSNAELVSVVRQYNEVENTKTKEKDAQTSNLQAYLGKLDVVPKSKLFSSKGVPKNNADSTFTNTEFFEQSYAIYCFDDSDFFDLLKQFYLRDKYKKGKSLSTLIPIKYTFTILGNSGIRRGDVFRISGIPKKYSEKGIFQITEIEHNLEGSKWTTQIGGLFRQIQ